MQDYGVFVHQMTPLQLCKYDRSWTTNLAIPRVTAGPSGSILGDFTMKSAHGAKKSDSALKNTPIHNFLAGPKANPPTKSCSAPWLHEKDLILGPFAKMSPTPLESIPSGEDLYWWSQLPTNRWNMMNEFHWPIRNLSFLPIDVAPWLHEKDLILGPFAKISPTPLESIPSGEDLYWWSQLSTNRWNMMNEFYWPIRSLSFLPIDVWKLILVIFQVILGYRNQ